MSTHDQPELTGLDRLTRSAAVAISRRSFIKRMSGVAAAVGLGLGVATASKAASASPDCVPPDYWTEDSWGGCGSCGAYKETHKYRSCHYSCTGSVVCGSWTTAPCISC